MDTYIDSTPVSGENREAYRSEFQTKRFYIGREYKTRYLCIDRAEVSGGYSISLCI